MATKALPDMTEKELEAENQRLEVEKLGIRNQQKGVQAELTLRADKKRFEGMSPDRLARVTQTLKATGVEPTSKVGTPGTK